MTLSRAWPTAAARVGVFLLFLLVAGVQAEWHVPTATLRYTVELTDAPSHREAGYFLHIPDGGALPTPYPLTTVVTKSGKPLGSYVLWHNVMGGLGIIFEAPASGGTVLVYVGRGPQLKTWTPDSGIYPSGILCMRPGGRTLQAAKSMASFGAVSPEVHYSRYEGHFMAPVSIPSGGDLAGRPLPCAFYLLTHLVPSDPGRTWVSPFIMAGACEVSLNGHQLEYHKRNNKWGGTGAWADLKKGMNRVDILQAVVKEPVVPDGMRRNQGGAAMFLAIKPPHITPSELGADVPVAGSEDKKPAGFAQLEARMVRSDEVARSGGARAVGVAEQQGAPVAVPSAKAKYVFWMEGQETPIILYELSAATEGNPEGTQYTWQFDQRGTAASGATVYWLFNGRQEQSVTLTASHDKKRSQSRRDFYAYGTAETSLDDETVRSALRQASLTMFKSVNTSIDPMESLGEYYWRILSQSLSLGEGEALAEHLLNERLNLVRKTLSPETLDLLKDIQLDAITRDDPKKALVWLADMGRRTSAIGERGRLTLAEAEIRMFYFGETNTVARMLVPLTRQQGDVGEMAKIRLGDLAFISGDLNRATELYADVQNRVRLLRNTEKRDSGRNMGGGLARNKAELKAQREQRLSSPTSRRSDTPVENWKLTAFLGVSASETSRSLINQGYWQEAKDALDAWERQFPLDKISSDFVLQEARYYMKRGDAVRVRKMLDAYCSNLDNTSYMGDTAWLLLACMAEMKDPRKEIFDFAEEMVKRFEFHPAAGRFRDYVQFRK
jgi:hypothetical protein